MRKHTFNVTYVEGILLLTNGVSVSALHRQHSILEDQKSVIAKLSSDLDRLNQELLELKTVKTLDTDIVDTKIVETGPSLVSDFTSYLAPYLDPKILGGIVLAGTVYYVTPYLWSKLVLPSFKSILIPVKSAAVACLPFMKEVQLLESIKNGCTYRVELTGNKLSGIEVRRADSHEFEQVSDLITQHSLQQDNIQSLSLDSSVSSNNTVSDKVVQTLTDDIVVDISQNVDIVSTTQATETLVNALTSLS